MDKSGTAEECYKEALDTCMGIQTAASGREACRIAYGRLRASVGVERLFCVTQTDPFQQLPPVIRYIAHWDSGKELLPLPRSLAYDELITGILGSGALLSSRNLKVPDSQLGPELRGMSCWVLSPVLLVSGKVFGVLGAGRQNGAEFSSEESYLIGNACRSISKVILIYETIQHVKQQERNRVIGETRGSVLHELINEIGTLPLLVSALEEELQESGLDYPEMVDVHLSSLHTVIKQLAATINDRMNQIKETIGSRKVEQINVGDLVRYTVHSLDRPKSKYTLACEIQPEAEAARIQACRPDVEDVIRNIVQNALQAMSETEERTLRVLVEGHTDDNGMDWVKVVIADTGRGIRPEALPRIWDLSYSTKSGTGGFGLYWVKNVVEELGGRIEVQSKLNRGTTFSIVLPCYHADGSIMG